MHPSFNYLLLVAGPGPFSYKVYRGDGPTGPVAATPITTTSSESYTDETALNTEENVYNYRIDAYDPSDPDPVTGLIGQSKTASSVRLEASSLLRKIELNWTATVPWSNQINTVPNVHEIYRGPEGAADDQLVLIASVDVKVGGFHYIDGEDTPLEDNKVYCYRVMTRGGYGNPAIPQPLENFSQTICAQPGDETAPCKPESPMPKDVIPCETYLVDSGTCGRNTFTNTITWDRPEDTGCRNDIAYYNIYVALSTAGPYTLVKTKHSTTEYIDANLPSYARCYKISAVDRSGNESELSDPICFDNCPYYELPNVFTPNLDDCNAVFSAYSSNERYEILPKPSPEAPSTYRCGGVADPSKCARFVQRVVFRVYNRWGKEVYTYTGSIGDEVNTIYIDWDGRADDGSDLATGVYYYVADVTFDTVDPSNKQKVIKGWVHLLR